jgi:GH35 family endo-1,4-beta-xylanase
MRKSFDGCEADRSWLRGDHRRGRHVMILVFAVLSVLFSLQGHAQSDTIQTNVPALKNVYAHDFYIGCILSYRNIGFPDDPYVPGQSAVVTPNGGYLVKFHMNSMSPGNNMKALYTVDIASSAAAYSAATTQTQRDSIETHPVVKFNGDMIAQLNWAKRQGFTFRGHTLVWYNQTPGTALFRSGYTTTGTRLTKEKMTDRMDNYIGEVIRLIHEGWPGLLSAMDVVNEAVNDDGTDRTSNNEWYTTFGDNSYIMTAFEQARKYTIRYGETQIKLYYNDYNEDNASKANGIVRICGPIFRAGYLDGIGMQGHDAINRPTAAQWIGSYNKFDTICTEMAVTEYYVDQGTSSPTPASLAAQANQYAMLFKLFVERSYFSGRGKIINLTKDGLNDQYTLFPNTLSSLWDSNNQCKPAFFAVVSVGINYNALDSLIAYTNTLRENDYSPGSWSTLVAARDSAKHVMGRNYSFSVSADTALSEARDFLQSAVSGLVVTGLEAVGRSHPEVFALSQNYPNPFNPMTVISYQLPGGNSVKLSIYNLLGQRLRTLVDSYQSAGEHSLVWDATDAKNMPVSSGVYFYRLEAGGWMLQKKMVLIR